MTKPLNSCARVALSLPFALFMAAVPAQFDLSSGSIDMAVAHAAGQGGDHSGGRGGGHGGPGGGAGAAGDQGFGASISASETGNDISSVAKSGTTTGLGKAQAVTEMNGANAVGLETAIQNANEQHGATQEETITE